jgi:nucleoside-diphosphate-sugar epimerase
MNVLLLGANGYMGPHVVRALAPSHRLRITDVRPAPKEVEQTYGEHEFQQVDVTDREHVLRAAAGMDAIVNLSVVRQDPRLAFRVNMLGCYHVMQAAAKHQIRRVINTGPHFTVAGPTYEGIDFGIPPDVPPHPGTGLYPLSKSLGHEICRILAEAHDIYVQEYLFYSLRETGDLAIGAGGVPFTVSWRDAAEVFRLGLEIDLAQLPTRFEVFFILGDAPQGQFRNDKAKRLLGFRPRDDVSRLWRRAAKAD